MSTRTVSRQTIVHWHDITDASPIDRHGVTWTPNALSAFINNPGPSTLLITREVGSEIAARAFYQLGTDEIPDWACHYLDEAIVLAAGGDPR